MLPLALGLVPFGMAIGTAAARADLPPILGWASSVFLYGGSGQLALIEVLGEGGPAVGAVFAALLVNLQMILYGFGMRSFWADQPLAWRSAAAYLLVGPVFAVTSACEDGCREPAARRAFYVAAAATLWCVWLTTTGLGFVVGNSLPEVPIVGLLTPLVLVSLAVRSAKGRAQSASLLVGASVAVVCRGIPHDLGFLAGVMAGVAFGMLVDRAGSGRES